MNSKSDKVLEGAAVWGAFYRKNPQRFVADYLNIYLKTFQKILIYLLLNCTNGLIVASRGIGKTWLLALYCIIRCILAFSYRRGGLRLLVLTRWAIPTGLSSGASNGCSLHVFFVCVRKSILINKPSRIRESL